MSVSKTKPASIELYIISEYKRVVTYHTLLTDMSLLVMLVDLLHHPEIREQVTSDIRSHQQTRCMLNYIVKLSRTIMISGQAFQASIGPNSQIG